MIVVIESAIAAAFAFATSVGLHHRVPDMPDAPLSTRLAFDAAGALAVANGLAHIAHPSPPEASFAATVLMVAAAGAWAVALSNPVRS